MSAEIQPSLPTGEALTQKLTNMASMSQTGLDIQREFAERAMTDDDFRTQLIEDPKSVFEQEFGLAIPDDLEIKVHVNDFQTVHLTLPMDYKLSEEQLEAVAAGLCCCG